MRKSAHVRQLSNSGRKTITLGWEGVKATVGDKRGFPFPVVFPA